MAWPLSRAICVVVLVAGCGSAPAEQHQAPHHGSSDGTVTLTGEARDWVRVEQASAPSATARRTLFARVSFDDRLVAAIGSAVSGRVTAVNVVTGADVTQGQALAVIHSADVAAARAALSEARQARMLADQTAARARLLCRQGAGSEAEAQTAETAAAEAHLQETAAGQSLSAIGASAAEVDYVLRSPRAGTVVERSVEVGNAVGADTGAPLLTVADLSRVWVLVDVYEHDLPYVHQGDSAHVVVPALGDTPRDGTIAYVGAVVDADTRTARARIELDNPNHDLRPGMFAQVEVESPDSAVAVVPTSAVLARRDEMYVFVQTGEGTYQQRRVHLGLQAGDHVAIRDGIAATDMVVTRGAILLDAEANNAF